MTGVQHSSTSLTNHIIFFVMLCITIHLSTAAETVVLNDCAVALSLGCNCTSDTQVDCAGSNINAALILPQLTNETSNIVTNIRFYGTVLSRVSIGMMSPSTRLLHLHLDYNGIVDIDVGAFRNVTGLETLSLENNRIRVLNPGTFSGLRRLTVLNLAGNWLYFIDVELFSWQDVPTLTELDLRGCRINDFEIRNLTSLVNVNLTSNRLTSFPMFGQGLTNLTAVFLSSNSIRSLDNVTLPFPGPKILHLRDNLIESLSNKSLFSKSSSSAESYQLEELDLTGNKINVIEIGSLSAASQLHTLKLSFNHLTTIDKAALPWNTLTKVLVHDNPWNCTVVMVTFGTQVTECVNGWLFNETSVKKWNNGTNVSCASPAQLFGKNIYASSVFNKCFATEPATSSRQGAVIYVSITIVICTVALICLIVYITRLRRSRKHHRPIFSNPSTSSQRRRGFGILSSATGTREHGGDRSTVDGDDAWSSKISYRQMDDLTPGSFTADQNEL